MKVLGLLQNQWARNPERVAQMFARRPEQRHQLIARMLMQSWSGRRLKAAFGDWVNQIVWENASPGIVGHSGGMLTPDVGHIERTLAQVTPDVVIAFGQPAAWGLRGSGWAGRTIRAPHPAARCGDIERRLRDACRELEIVSEAVPR